MACYISSNGNRHYAALEAAYCEAAAASPEVMLPSLRLGIRDVTETPRRRDKTGSRTFPGVPAGLRRRVSWDLGTYLTEWPDPETPPCYGALVRAAMGAEPLVFTGATVQGVTNDTEITTAAAHGLVPGQAVRSGNDIRFVAAAGSATSFVVNAPFTVEPAANSALGASITYRLARTLPSVTLYDYWDPAEAVQRMVIGAAVDRMRVRVNGDFHQLQFVGEAAALAENVAFTAGMGGLDEFPEEPAVAPGQRPLIPGSLGQAWIGVEPRQFHTVLEAEVLLDNGLWLRAEEFGQDKPKCIGGATRSVTLDMRLVSNTNDETGELYQAARQRSPVAVMFQLGHRERQLCGVYMPQVVPEIPEFDDREARLQWRLRDSRAQGAGDDELVIAFA